jgi:succinate dehydrogenase/fumarate reductase flavoprotein subunit
MTFKDPSAPLLGDTYDLIVVGSGCGGLATAVSAAHFGLSVLVLEKAPVVGGTTAWSGGWMWVPGNPLATEAGIHEDIDQSKRYLTSLFGKPVSDRRVDYFLEKGPQAIRFYRDIAGLKFIDGNKVPDFYVLDGSQDGGRSLCAAPFDGRELGAWINKLRPPLSVISLWGMGIAAGQDLKHFFNARTSPTSALYVIRRIGKHLFDLLRHRRGMQLVNGNALIAGLLKSALSRDVDVKTEVTVQQLLKNSSGRVTGVRASVDNQIQELTARYGVVVATGGFPHDVARQSQQFGTTRGTRHYSAAPKTNTGDGLHLAEAQGAQVRNDLLQPGAWSPVSLVPDGRGDYIHFPHLIERAKPGIIAVLPDGRRFTNEAESYHDFMQALFDATPTGQEPYCWLIADHKAQRQWGLGWSRPFPFPLAGYRRCGYLKSAPTVEALAELCGIEVHALNSTVQRFNRLAIAGKDSDFQRGNSVYNRVQGNPNHGPNPSLAALEAGPFHAVKIVAGSLGTFSGICTNEYGQALDASRQPIPGLFAAGNDMSSIFDGFYPSGGITLGPAMTFGFVIAEQLVAESATRAYADSRQNDPLLEENT